MMNLFYTGGPLFMGILTLLFLLVLALSVISWLQLSGSNLKGLEFKINGIKSVGLFAMVMGILAQLIGLFDAFKAIEVIKDVSPQMLAGGLKVSMITTVYGIIIYAISLIIWFVLKWKINSREN